MNKYNRHKVVDWIYLRLIIIRSFEKTVTSTLLSRESVAPLSQGFRIVWVLSSDLCKAFTKSKLSVFESLVRYFLVLFFHGFIIGGPINWIEYMNSMLQFVRVNHFSSNTVLSCKLEISEIAKSITDQEAYREQPE